MVLNPKCYSFGKKYGENTRIPLLIANKLGLNYAPIYLEEEYEASYASNALKAIYLADGISIPERANYIYTMQKIAEYSHYNITGLIAEFFGAVNLIGGIFNKNYFRSVYEGRAMGINQMLQNMGISKILSLGYFHQKRIIEEFSDRLDQRTRQVQLWKQTTTPWNYYVKDLITLGIRRFYGSQMHTERYYCENLSPFYDYNVLAYLFKSTHQFLFKNSFNRSPVTRKNNRMIQASIIRRNYFQLGEIPLDRGYAPNYLFDYRFIFVPYYFYKRKLMLKFQPPDFISPVWIKLFYQYYMDNCVNQIDGYFDREEILTELTHYQPDKYNRSLSHLLGLSTWMQQKS